MEISGVAGLFLRSSVPKGKMLTKVRDSLQ